jgi:hypothetical protein
VFWHATLLSRQRPMNPPDTQGISCCILLEIDPDHF